MCLQIPPSRIRFFLFLLKHFTALENQDNKTHTVIKQTILFLQADVVFDKLQKKNYTVNGGSHNIVSNSKRVSKNTQNNNFEMNILKLENDFFKK